MAAYRLWVELAIEVLVYVVLIIALVAPEDHATALLLIPVWMLAVRIALVLASFWLSEPLSTAAHLSPSARWRMWICESVALYRFQSLIMSGAGPDRFVPQAANEKPVIVLLHGIFCNGAIWRPLAAALADRTGCEVHTPSMPRVTASLATQVDDFAALLEAQSSSGARREVIVVGHSLGGLIAHRAAMRHGDRLGIVRLICIGTPHGGSEVARLSRTRIARDLRPNSPALARARSNSIEVVNIFAEHDNLVVPAQSSRLCCARNIPIAGCGHMALIYSRKVFEILVQEVAREAEHALTAVSDCR